MRRDIKGRRIVVTGASSGIGKAVATLLAQRGAKLLLVGRSEEKLKEVAPQLQPMAQEVWVSATDISREEDRQRLLQEIAYRWQGLDAWINNAGIASWSHFAESSEEVLRQVMEVNFFAPAELLRGAIPLLEKGVQPAIANVTSMCARVGMPAWPEYSASKFALYGLTESLRGELVKQGIDVLVVLPGLTRTGLHSRMLKNEGKAQIDFAKGMDPEQVAQPIVRALETNRRETIIGADARWMIRVHDYVPALFRRLLARRVRALYAQN